MSFKPILFSTEMVQAILDGRKTQTRRLINPQPTINRFGNVNFGFKKIVGRNIPIENLNKPFVGIIDSCPYGQPGDVLWVRETWNVTILKASTNKMDVLGNETIRYKASKDEFNRCTKGIMKWKPSIHMPKEACRIFLKVTDVRVERLQDISEEDAIAEGIKGIGENEIFGGESYEGKWYENYGEKGYSFLTPKHSFQSLWQSINGVDSWEANPCIFSPSPILNSNNESVE